MMNCRPEKQILKQQTSVFYVENNVNFPSPEYPAKTLSIVEVEIYIKSIIYIIAELKQVCIQNNIL